jgi:hypothetical protein
MWYLYLDESGDLGFDFVNKKPSKFFTITILAVRGYDLDRKLAQAVKVTLRRKLNPSGCQRRLVKELKGTNTALDIKKYFYEKAKNIEFGIYSITLNKQKVYERLTKEKPRVYNWIARLVLDQIPFDKDSNERVCFVIDKSKSKPEIEDFNCYIRRQLEGRLNPKTPLDINHLKSHESHGLQAADIFCWGIFQKHERKKVDWFDVFAEEKIKFDQDYF